MTASDDFKIIKAVISGDKEAFASLVRAHEGRIRQICSILLSNSVEAEDVAQDVFVKAYQSLAEFRGQSSFSTWLYRIAYNRCMDIFRQKARHRTESLEELLDIQGDRATDLFVGKSGQASPGADRMELEEILASLRPEQREILVLREMSGLTYAEMASFLGCSLDAVKARLKRARQELKEKARHIMGSEIV